MTGLRTRSAEYEAVRQTSVTEVMHNTAAMISHQSDAAVADPSHSKRQLRCGWGTFAPSGCQRFRNAKCFLFWLCWAGALQVSDICFLCCTTFAPRSFGMQRDTPLNPGGVLTSCHAM